MRDHDGAVHTRLTTLSPQALADRHLPGQGHPGALCGGYLFTDRQAGDRSDPDATHAWVEVLLPALRWTGFDPTNNVLTGERHILVAVGRDYADVPPSLGVYKGEADSHLSVAVSVGQAKAAVAEPEFLRMARPTFPGGRRRSGDDARQREQQPQQQQ